MSIASSTAVYGWSKSRSNARAYASWNSANTVESPRHHRLDYVEIATTDIARSKKFYADAFGWAFNDYGPDYAGIQGASKDDPDVGGLNPQGKPSRDGVFVLLFSNDLDASVESVKAAGGEVVEGPYEFPGGRRFHFTDPSGNELGVFAEA